MTISKCFAATVYVAAIIKYFSTAGGAARQRASPGQSSRMTQGKRSSVCVFVADAYSVFSKNTPYTHTLKTRTRVRYAATASRANPQW